MGKNTYIDTKRGCGRLASFIAAPPGWRTWLSACATSLVFFFAARGACQTLPWCAPVLNEIAQAIAHDNFSEADSLFASGETQCGFDGYDLLKWMRIKAVLGKYGDAGAVACKALRRRPQLSFSLPFQLLEIIRESPLDTIRAVVRQYGQCALCSEQADTVALRRFLAGAYGRFGLYEEELDALRDLDSKKNPSVQEIVAIAFRRFSRHLYAETIPAALAAYRRSSDPAAQSSCALMLYQSYARIDKKDSTAMWLGRASLTTPQARADAIAFFQRGGCYAKADSLLAGLGPSLTRDTLAVRGMLLSGNFKAASDLCSKMAGSYTGKEVRGQARLWKARALLFGGSASEALDVLDSMEFSPTMAGADEFVPLIYALKSLRKAWRAGEVLGALAYAAWMQSPQLAEAALRSPVVKSLPIDAGQMLIAEGVKTLIAGSSFSAARAAIALADSSSLSSQLRYYRGVILFNLGEVEAGRAVLEDLLLRGPGDVFSERARMFLGAPMDKPVQKQ